MKYSNNKDYFDEVMQEGSIGLFEAYQNYDPNQYSVKFWSYAWYRVRGRMISFIDRHANLLKVSRNIKDIASKIKDMDMISWDAVNIAEVINHPILEVNSALVFLRNRYVDSLNRTMNYKGQSYLELGDILPDNNDYFATDEDELWNLLSEVEQQYLSFKLQDYSIKRIRKELNLTKEEQNKIEISLKCKAEKVFHGDFEDNMTEVEYMTSNSVMKTLSKEEYLKHKKNKLLDKDIYNKYSITKSALIKLKTDWGIPNSRSTKKKKKTIAISSPSKILKNEITSEVKDVSNTNQVKVLNERIAELENILRETQNKLKSCENEREALWRIQDILRSRLVV